MLCRDCIHRGRKKGDKIHCYAFPEKIIRANCDAGCFQEWKDGAWSRIFHCTKKKDRKKIYEEAIKNVR